MPAITIETLRSAGDFAKAYNWNIGFPDFGSQFFPCHSFTDPLLIFQNNNFDYGPWAFSYPEKSSRGFNLALEVYELDDYSIITYLNTWASKIQGDDYTMNLIGAPGVAKEMYLERFNGAKQQAHFETVLVIPDGEVSIPHTSEKGGAPLSISLNLIIVS